MKFGKTAVVVAGTIAAAVVFIVTSIQSPTSLYIDIRNIIVTYMNRMIIAAATTRSMTSSTSVMSLFAVIVFLLFYSICFLFTKLTMSNKGETADKRRISVTDAFVSSSSSSSILSRISPSMSSRRNSQQQQQVLRRHSTDSVPNEHKNEDENDEEDMSNSSRSKSYASSLLMVPFSVSLSTTSITQLWEDIFLSPESAMKSPFRILKPEEEDELFFSTSSTAGTTIVDTAENDTTSDNNCSSCHEKDNDEDKNHHTVPKMVHFCFLVHGHRGHSRDLSYVQAVMKRLAQQRYQSKEQQQQPGVQQKLIVHSVRCNEKKTDDGVIAGGTRLMNEMLHVIRTEMALLIERQHSQNTSNSYDNLSTIPTITISFWGNSLGGLYSRYALSLLSEHCPNITSKTSSASTQNEQNQKQQCWLLDSKYEVYLNVFCTTATPHLGISGHTFVTLPRRAEIGLATAMGTTGKDLFRINTILYDMATNEQYITPLSLFRKRICYANAYGTDFPVPASTAAFLSDHSTYPHYVTDDDDQTINTDINDSTSLVQVATLYTKRRTTKGNTHEQTDHIVASTNDATLVSSDIELAQMSTSLDSLGWKKVFVDMRKEVPHIVLPKSLIRRGSGTLFASSSSSKNIGATQTTTSMESERSITSSSDEEDEATELTMSPTKNKLTSSSSSSSIPVEPIHRMLKKRRVSKRTDNNATLVLSSKDVAAAVSTSALLFDSSTMNSHDGLESDTTVAENDTRTNEQRDDVPNSIGKVNDTDETHFAIHWPLGHNMIVAFSRSRWSAHMNKAGRPVVDALAKEIVDDIFAYQQQQ